MVMGGAPLVDKREYQDKLARRKGLPATTMGGGSIPKQQPYQVEQEKQMSRELEQEKQQFQPELMAANIRAERAEQQVQELQEQVSDIMQNQHAGYMHLYSHAFPAGSHEHAMRIRRGEDDILIVFKPNLITIQVGEKFGSFQLFCLSSTQIWRKPMRLLYYIILT